MGGEEGKDVWMGRRGKDIWMGRRGKDVWMGSRGKDASIISCNLGELVHLGVLL